MGKFELWEAEDAHYEVNATRRNQIDADALVHVFMFFTIEDHTCLDQNPNENEKQSAPGPAFKRREKVEEGTNFKLCDYHNNTK
mmetsp:Transcript_47755/g.65037  ORF Transcript_47755/g.65037 Transcript_47755/m.65037 type:complete len:84 (-) Transcript_47755:239-490(-)